MRGVWMQVELQGVTGHVAFDENGHRRDFQLSVNELNLNTDARPVLTKTNNNNNNNNKRLIIIVIITSSGQRV